MCVKINEVGDKKNSNALTKKKLKRRYQTTAESGVVRGWSSRFGSGVSGGLGTVMCSSSVLNALALHLCNMFCNNLVHQGRHLVKAQMQCIQWNSTNI